MSERRTCRNETTKHATSASAVLGKDDDADNSDICSSKGAINHTNGRENERERACYAHVHYSVRFGRLGCVNSPSDIALGASVDL